MAPLYYPHTPTAVGGGANEISIASSFLAPPDGAVWAFSLALRDVFLSESGEYSPPVTACAVEECPAELLRRAPSACRRRSKLTLTASGHLKSRTRPPAQQYVGSWTTRPTAVGGTGGLSNFDGPGAHTKKEMGPMSSISDAIHATPSAGQRQRISRIDLVSLGQQVVGRLIEFLIFSVRLTCHRRNRIERHGTR